MSKLDRLIAELCPYGVEYSILGNITSITRGVRVVRSQLSEKGKYPVYQNSMTPLGYFEESNCKADTVFIISAGAAGEIGFSYVDYWVADDCFRFACPKQLQDRFLYYSLLCQQDYLYSKVRKVSVPRLARNVIEQMKIPLPPLPIQKEIVKILDNFTELSAELSAELLARKKQYEYYRNKVLTFGDDVPMVTFSEIARITSGKNKDKTQSGKHPVFGSTGIIGYTDKPAYKGKKILVARVGANCGYVHKAAGEYDVSDNTLVIEVERDFNMQFIFYILVNMKINRYAKGGGQPLVTARQLKDLHIPLPSLEEQERIVAILDRFDALTSDITGGLPAEIAARQKQYEYYRDKLLTFKEVSPS